MQTFLQFVTEEQLQEKLIVVGGGANYGQIIFLAGGGGSGKGFAADNFLEASKFKIRDVDAMKLAFLELNRIYGEVKKLPDCDLGQHDSQHASGISAPNFKTIPNLKDAHGKLACNPFFGLKGMNLRTPGDVFKLHDYVDQLDVKDKTLLNMMTQAKQSKGHLPNILFDITAKNVKSIEKVISGDGKLPGLVDIGYEPKNIHLIWILADYSVAVERNAKRSRVVPDDILLQTHEGAANTMWEILNGKVPNKLDGGIYVVLNRDLTSDDYYKDTGNRAAASPVSKFKPSKTVKDFTYIRYKDAGKPMNAHADVQQQIYNWITANIPKSAATAHIFDAGKPNS